MNFDRVESWGNALASSETDLLERYLFFFEKLQCFLHSVWVQLVYYVDFKKFIGN